MTVAPQGANPYEATVTRRVATEMLGVAGLVRKVGVVPGLHPGDDVAVVEAWLARGWGALELAYDPTGTTPRLGRVGDHDVELSMTEHGAGHDPAVAAGWDRFAGRRKQVLVRGAVPVPAATDGPIALGHGLPRRNDHGRSKVPLSQRLVCCCPAAQPPDVGPLALA